MLAGAAASAMCANVAMVNKRTVGQAEHMHVAVLMLQVQDGWREEHALVVGVGCDEEDLVAPPRPLKYDVQCDPSAPKCDLRIDRPQRAKSRIGSSHIPAPLASTHAAGRPAAWLC